MSENPVEKRSRGLFSKMFGRRSLWSKKWSSENKTSMSSSNASPTTTPTTTANIQFTKSPGHELNSKMFHDHKVSPEPIQTNRPISKPSSNQNPNNRPGQVQPQGRKVPREAIGLSGELESMIIDNQKARGKNGYGVKKKTTEEERPTSVEPISVSDNQGSLCRAVSTRMDPETLKIMGNEDFKNGNYAEALALYEAAIAIEPRKAAYRSNKSAALAALGRFLEAIFECKEAIRMEPHYHRAHLRLANLYLRLGEMEKSIYHFKHSGPEANQEDISKAKMVQTHLNKCTEAKRLRDWKTLIRETENILAAGTDAAPQVYALQAEAYLKSCRHQEADDALSKCPVFNVEMSTKYYGPIGCAGFLVVWAQVHMSSGRFGEAVEAIKRANKLDGNNKEARTVLYRAQAVAAARSKGNDFFKAGRFHEACASYGDGLDHDSRNSILLCNRATCLSKMGYFDRAVEDSTLALTVRPGYTKARLRRADCNYKLGNWEAAIGDYEILKKETPEDEEVIKGLSEAQKQLMIRRGPDS